MELSNSRHLLGRCFAEALPSQHLMSQEATQINDNVNQRVVHPGHSWIWIWSCGCTRSGGKPTWFPDSAPIRARSKSKDMSSDILLYTYICTNSLLASRCCTRAGLLGLPCCYMVLAWFGRHVLAGLHTTVGTKAPARAARAARAPTSQPRRGSHNVKARARAAAHAAHDGAAGTIRAF